MFNNGFNSTIKSDSNSDNVDLMVFDMDLLSLNQFKSEIFPYMKNKYLDSGYTYDIIIRSVEGDILFIVTIQFNDANVLDDLIQVIYLDIMEQCAYRYIDSYTDDDGFKYSKAIFVFIVKNDEIEVLPEMNETELAEFELKLESENGFDVTDMHSWYNYKILPLKRFGIKPV
jgi:hypothetical protein